MTTINNSPNPKDHPPARRRFLGVLGKTLLTATGVTTSLSACQPSPKPKQSKQDTQANHSPCQTHLDKNQTYAFYGERQAGIATPQQKHCYFLVLELHNAQDGYDKAAIAKLLQTWTTMSASLTQGNNALPYTNNPHLPPADTGEADSLGAWGLTLTFGVSATFFDKLGLTHKKPPELQDLPHFPRDQLKPHLTGGDVCIQACCNDVQVAFHAVRQLVRAGRTLINLKYAKTGFVSFDDNQTPRNLFGFKDGTANHSVPESDVWLDDPTFKNSTFLVVRTIAMHLETWDRTSLAAQEATFLRHRKTGAPLGKTDEFDPLDAHTVGADVAHSSLAHATGQTLFRRSYSYNDGIHPITGQFDTGLLFISFQRSPKQFVTIQNALGNLDKMTEYTTHIGSGLFWCFSGVSAGEFLGQAIFD